MLLEPSKTTTMSIGPPHAGKVTTGDVWTAARSQLWTFSVYIYIYFLASMQPTTKISANLFQNIGEHWSYSGRQERRQLEAGRGGSVWHIFLGRSPDCHTAVPKEDHTSITERKRHKERFVTAFLKALMSEFTSNFNCKFSVTDV